MRWTAPLPVVVGVLGTLPGLVLLLVMAAIAQQDPADDFAQRLAAVVPDGDEVAWRAVPWRPALRDALVEGSQLDRPVLLWAMNGHPLGQT